VLIGLLYRGPVVYCVLTLLSHSFRRRSLLLVSYPIIIICIVVRYLLLFRHGPLVALLSVFVGLLTSYCAFCDVILY
jgi:hypothetical protein